MSIRVLIADDQEMMRSAYGMILGAQPDMEVVASVGDGEAAVSEARRLRPDVCLLDIRMPRVDGLEATRLLAGPGVRDPVNVLIATTFDLDEYVYRALRHGACGFLLKDMSPALLVEAVRAAAAGTSMISPNVTVRLLAHLAPERGAAEAEESAALVEPLTERELEVVRLVALGRTNDEVAGELHLGVATVKTHLGNAQRKLVARNRVEVAAWAWRTGVVSGRG
ncbi:MULTISPECIES: response regulator transcription factor [Actinosynnema]|uniref:response regulator n=1 Tax=Actinosynnema TaxID=40566 RepID=UPI0020A60E06|nr:response regulator transcription factor [Actinosynnema pretiosum]MCP2098466.1 two component transcriptional regulator, LuxR family [Actinosynnema pretiosum]